MKVLFPFIVTLFFGMVHYLVYTRIISRLHIKSHSRTLLKYLLIINMTAIIGYITSYYALNPPRLLYFIFSLSMGVGFVLFVGIILYEFLHLFWQIIPFSEEKRYFLKRSGDIAFLSLGTAYIGAGIAEGSKDPMVKFVDVAQERFGGKIYKIVQVSDMHIGGLIDKEFVVKSVAMINRLEPDLIAITGDLCDADIEAIKEAIDELGYLKSRYGTYYIVGNHEYFHSIDTTIAYIKTLGIHVFENSAVCINNDFYIAGVYDLFGNRMQSHMPNIHQAMQDIPPEFPTLLLAHQPKFAEYLEGFTPALILSGHTHGGQIWPFGYLVKLAQPYIKGLHQLDAHRHIYINSGIGFWGPPMRLGSQAEITCISWS